MVRTDRDEHASRSCSRRSPSCATARSSSSAGMAGGAGRAGGERRVLPPAVPAPSAFPACPTCPPTDNQQVTTKKSEPPAGFNGLGLIDELSAAVAALGYEEPTPVQRETIPLLLAGRDLLGQAATGTGKTAAFALPMLQRLSREADARKQTGGLVLVPTRELAMQVAEAIHKYAQGASASPCCRSTAARRCTQQIRDARARRRRRRRHAGPRARSHPARDAEARRTCACWSSTKPTRCSTWGSPRTSTRSSRRRRRPGRRRCSRRRCRRGSCRSPSGT